MKRASLTAEKKPIEALLRLRSLGIKDLWMEDTGLLYLEQAVYCRRSYDTNLHCHGIHPLLDHSY